MATIEQLVYVLDAGLSGPPSSTPGVPGGTNIPADVFAEPTAGSSAQITGTAQAGSGSVILQLQALQYSIGATAPGYVDTSQWVTVDLTGGEEGNAVYIYLQPSSDKFQDLTLAFNPLVEGTTWSLTGPGSPPTSVSGSVANGSVLVTGGSLSGLPLGSYSLTATAAGYNAYSNSFTLSAANSAILVQLVKSAGATNSPSPNVPPGTAKNAIAQAILKNPLTSSLPAQAEWIPPFDAFNKYFTATQARVYVGNMFIDEVNGLQFVLQDNTIPIFGYASRYVDAYGQGRSLVQGQLVLNFISEAYLLTMLQNAVDSVGGNLDNTAQSVKEIVNLDSNAQNLATNGDPNAMLSAVLAARNQLLAGAGPSAVTAIKKARPMGTQPRASYNNAVYQSVTFDLEVDLGDGPTKRVRRLEKVKLTSNEVIFDQSGSPVLDTYGFVARRLL